MAKTGVVRAGRTVELGTKDKDGNLARKTYGPGQKITLEDDEFDRLTALEAIALPNSGEAQAAAIAADQIPSTFPGRDILKKAGITTFSQLKQVENLEAIEGMTPVAAQAITEALEA